MKFSGEADARDKQKNLNKSMIIKILDGLSCLLLENYKDAAYRLSSVQLIDDPAIYSIITPSDLAYYITMSCLAADFSRKDMRDLIMQSS